MAKKRGRQSGEPNKSEAIRNYLRANPGAKPKAVVEGLKQEGIEVASALVSNIKNTLRNKGDVAVAKKPGAKRGPKKKNAEAAISPNGLTLEKLFEAKELVAKLGGLDSAKKALEALASFSDIK